MSCNNFTQDIPAMFVIGRLASFAVDIDLSDTLDDLIFGVKQSKDDATYIAYASMTDGDVTQGDDGTYYLTVSSDKTANIAEGQYFYEIVAVYKGKPLSLVLADCYFKKGVINNG